MAEQFPFHTTEKGANDIAQIVQHVKNALKNSLPNQKPHHKTVNAAVRIGVSVTFLL